MKKSSIRPFLFVILSVLIALLAWTVFWRGSPTHSPASDAGSENPIKALKDLERLPLSFEPTRNEDNPEVKFVARGAGYRVSLKPGEALLQMRRSASIPEHSRRETAVSENTRTALLRMQLIGADSAARVEGNDLLPGRSNYIFGKDPGKWRTGIPQYSRVRYHEVYEGIDLVFYGNQRRLEFDFEVAPGADPGNIRLGYEGIESMHIDSAGDLVLAASSGEIRQHKPRVYQTIAGIRRDIDGRYSI